MIGLLGVALFAAASATAPAPVGPASCPDKVVSSVDAQLATGPLQFRTIDTTGDGGPTRIAAEPQGGRARFMNEYGAPRLWGYFDGKKDAIVIEAAFIGEGDFVKKRAPVIARLERGEEEERIFFIDPDGKCLGRFATFPKNARAAKLPSDADEPTTRVRIDVDPRDLDTHSVVFLTRWKSGVARVDARYYEGHITTTLVPGLALEDALTGVRPQIAALLQSAKAATDGTAVLGDKKTGSNTVVVTRDAAGSITKIELTSESETEATVTVTHGPQGWTRIVESDGL